MAEALYPPPLLMARPLREDFFSASLIFTCTWIIKAYLIHVQFLPFFPHISSIFHLSPPNKGMTVTHINDKFKKKCKGPQTPHSSGRSVLGPLGFIVYINDIDLICLQIKLMNKFADDTKAANTIFSYQDVKDLQDCLDRLVTWADTWGMSFNVTKWRSCTWAGITHVQSTTCPAPSWTPRTPRWTLGSRSIILYAPQPSVRRRPGAQMWSLAKSLELSTSETGTFLLNYTKHMLGNISSSLF